MGAQFRGDQQIYPEFFRLSNPKMHLTGWKI